jgi:hypothetical protein
LPSFLRVGIDAELQIDRRSGLEEAIELAAGVFQRAESADGIRDVQRLIVVGDVEVGVGSHLRVGRFPFAQFAVDDRRLFHAVAVDDRGASEDFMPSTSAMLT